MTNKEYHTIREHIDKLGLMFEYHNKNLTKHQYNTINDLLENIKPLIYKDK